MRSPRSNPWPALADLFAALLIATFGGLVVISANGAQPSGATAGREQEIAQCKSENEALKKKLAEAKARAAPDELKNCLEAKITLNEMVETQQRRLKELSGGKGLDRPSCLFRDGRPVPLLEITVSEDGLEIRKLPQPENEQLMSGINGLEALASAGKIRDEDLRGLAGPIAAWGWNASGNALGVSCSFYAVLKPAGVEKSRLSTARAFVEDWFYLFNATEVNRFMKAKEN